MPNATAGEMACAAGAIAAKTFQLSRRTILIALPGGHCWLTSAGGAGATAVPGSVLAAERSTLAATAVEGALGAGLIHAGGEAVSGRYTLARYVRWLAGNYVFAGRTPGLFSSGAERLDAAGRPDLAAIARRKAVEESGHAALALRDLEALGLPAAEVVRLVQPPSASRFARQFQRYVDSGEPVALFGFSYCLERMAVARDRDFIRSVEAVCPPGARAFRFLKVHSIVGSDSGHVHEQLSLFESFTEPELAMVVRAVYETAAMLARQPRMDRALPDEEIARRLQRAGIALPPGMTVAGEQPQRLEADAENREPLRQRPGERVGAAGKARARTASLKALKQQGGLHSRDCSARGEPQMLGGTWVG